MTRWKATEYRRKYRGEWIWVNRDGPAPRPWTVYESPLFEGREFRTAKAAMRAAEKYVDDMKGRGK